MTGRSLLPTHIPKGKRGRKATCAIWLHRHSARTQATNTKPDHQPPSAPSGYFISTHTKPRFLDLENSPQFTPPGRVQTSTQNSGIRGLFAFLQFTCRPLVSFPPLQYSLLRSSPLPRSHPHRGPFFSLPFRLINGLVVSPSARRRFLSSSYILTPTSRRSYQLHLQWRCLSLSAP